MVQQLPHAHGLPLPSYATSESAGMDIHAATGGKITLLPGERKLIPSGICIAIPAGHEGQVRARSGLALKQGLGMVNAPGTIDSDYRGEIGVILINWSDVPQTICHGDRIAQLVISPVVRAEMAEVMTLDETERGNGGFGHTGK